MGFEAGVEKAFQIHMQMKQLLESEISELANVKTPDQLQHSISAMRQEIPTL